MEVTKSNFNEIYPMVCKSIDNADFITFDMVSNRTRYEDGVSFRLDTLDERYMKLRDTFTHYGIMQFGLSTFKIDISKKSVQTATYCFYLSGRTKHTYKYDTTCFEFLASKGFNFNKVFTDGLPFMSLQEEEAARKKHQHPYFPTDFQELKSVESRMFMTTITAKLQSLKHHLSGDKFVIPTTSLSVVERAIMFNNVVQQFPEYLIENNDHRRRVEITRFATKEEKDDFITKCNEESLQKKIGFGLIARKIMEAKKPIVSYRASEDVFNFVDKLVADLPETYSDFKILAMRNLPVIYDTKLISVNPPFSVEKNRTCVETYQRLRPHLADTVMTTEPGRKTYIDGDIQGYNAAHYTFMCGQIFLANLKVLHGSLWKEHFNLEPLQDYANKLHLTRSADIPYIDLAKDEALPNRSHIFVVDCPHTWENKDIKLLFSDLKRYLKYWANDTKVYVVPIAPASLSLSKVTPKCPPNVFVSMYKFPTSSISSSVKGKMSKG